MEKKGKELVYYLKEERMTVDEKIGIPSLFYSNTTSLTGLRVEKGLLSQISIVGEGVRLWTCVHAWLVPYLKIFL